MIRKSTALKIIVSAAILWSLMLALAAAPAPVKPRAQSKPTLVGKWVMMWVSDGENYCAGPAEFRADGTYTHVVEGTYTYNGTWVIKGRQLHVSEMLVGSPKRIDWSVDVETGVGESVEVWLKPAWVAR